MKYVYVQLYRSGDGEKSGGKFYIFIVSLFSDLIYCFSHELNNKQFL